MGGYFILIFSLLTWQNRVGKFGAPLLTVCANYNWKKKKRYQWVHTPVNQPLQARPYFPSLAQYSGAKVKGATKTCNLFCNLLSAGLLIFCAVAEPQNSRTSAKSREIHKNTQNAAKFARNYIEYMSVEHIWNLSWLLGLLGHILSIVSQRSLPRKFPRKHLAKKGRFYCEFVPKNPAKFDFFSATYQKPCIRHSQAVFFLFFSGKTTLQASGE